MASPRLRKPARGIQNALPGFCQLEVTFRRHQQVFSRKVTCWNLLTAGFWALGFQPAQVVICKEVQKRILRRY